MVLLFHIAHLKDWIEAEIKKEYRIDSFLSQGFIHCSLMKQIIAVANRFYQEQKDLVLLCIDSNKIIPEIKYESSKDNDEEYPHIYGPININAILKVVKFTANQNGEFELPKEVDELFKDF